MHDPFLMLVRFLRDSRHNGKLPVYCHCARCVVLLQLIYQLIHGLIKLVIAFINRHFAEDISIATICAWSGYGKSQLCRIFREETLQTISGQITVCCLNNARTLLSTGK